jgi:hypothetical protein
VDKYREKYTKRFGKHKPKSLYKNPTKNPTNKLTEKPDREFRLKIINNQELIKNQSRTNHALTP